MTGLIAIPPELREVVVLSVMNLGTVLGGFLMGRRANEAQKIIIGGFVAGVAGVAFAWLLSVFGLAGARPRSLAGVFVLSVLLGTGWAWLGFRFRPPT